MISKKKTKKKAVMYTGIWFYQVNKQLNKQYKQYKTIQNNTK